MPDARGHVALLATGGTIAAGPDGPLYAASLIRLAVNSTIGIPRAIPVRGVDLACTPSSCVTVASIESLASAIRDALDRPGCLGVVVTHGTDTLEEVAFACDLLIRERVKPVVFTGAMIPPRRAGTDAHANLAQAIRVAGAPGDRLGGVCVVMQGRVHAAIEVRKQSTSSVDAFVSMPQGPIGWIGPECVEIVRSAADVRVPCERLEPSVELVRLVAGGGATLVRAAAEGSRGLVVELFGAGNAGEDIQRAIAEAVDAGLVVLVCSRVGLGELTPGRGVIEAGAIPAVVQTPDRGGLELDGLKARVLLMAALGAGLDAAGLSRRLQARRPPRG